MNKYQLNRLSNLILKCSIEVHKEMGPGLLESIYENCLAKELNNLNIQAKRQVHLPLIYKGDALDKHFKIDLLVENEIIIEIKSTDHMIPVFEAQLISYLKLSNKRLGFLINFNVPRLVDGFRRFVNDF